MSQYLLGYQVAEAERNPIILYVVWYSTIALMCPLHPCITFEAGLPSVLVDGAQMRTAA
jgi:hypothetical protein